MARIALSHGINANVVHKWRRQTSGPVSEALPDAINRNIETVPRLYRQARPGSDFNFSLQLLQKFKRAHPLTLTKSGLVVGLGEKDAEVVQTMQQMVDHGVDMLTIGQYLAPSSSHLQVLRYVEPENFQRFNALGLELGFKHVAAGPLTRSSYRAAQHMASAQARAAAATLEASWG